MNDSPHDHDRPDGEPEPEQPEPEDEPARHRPGIAEQRAALAVFRAVLAGHDDEAHHAAGAAIGSEDPPNACPGGKDPCLPCPACATVAAASFGIAVAEQLAANLVRKLAPDAELDAGPIRAAILDVIDQAERELSAAGN